MILSKHFMTMDVNAIGLKSLFTFGQGFLGTGFIIDFFPEGGDGVKINRFLKYGTPC